MLLRQHSHAGGRRHGVILLVVLAILTLFALVGLSFVMYSDASATSARIFREAQKSNQVGTDSDRIRTEAQTLWQQFLGQLIYDLPDDAVGVQSALRGHSLGRTM